MRARVTAVATTLLVAVASLCLPLGPLAAQPPALPQPVGYVNDFANVIAPDAEARLVALAFLVRLRRLAPVSSA